MHNDTPHILVTAVDRLALVKAQIATLQKEEAELKQFLTSAEQPVIMGTTHRATVSLCEGRSTTDWQTIAMRFQPSRQLITAHTTVGEPYAAVRLSAHKTSK
jgi:hypothetical protein